MIRATPYTRGLLASLPKIDVTRDRLYSIAGAPPAPASRPRGCAFHPRCDEARALCRSDEPIMREVDGTVSACHFAQDLGPPARPGGAPSLAAYGVVP